MSNRAAVRKKIPPLVNKLVAPTKAGDESRINVARQGKMPIDELIKTADEWQKEGKVSQITELYTEWIKHTQSPYTFIACFNYGVLLASWGRDVDAIGVYELALAQNPQFAHARINLGLTMERLGQHEKALECWQVVAEYQDPSGIAAVEMQTTALNHIGRLHEQKRNYAEAEKALARSLELKPDQADAIHHWFHLRQKQCKWPVLEGFAQITKNAILNAMSPLAALAYDDDPAFQMHVAYKIVRDKFTYSQTPLSAGTRYKHNKMRIGYLSGDLCTHAVGLILPELFELHDRNKFEIYAYDYSREDGTALRQRYKSSIENFISIAQISDQQAAHKIRSDEIDILVDLHGLSLGVRAGIIAHRPATVQMTYLGYIGTTMMPYIDYVITDKYCFPPELETYYSEKPLLINRCCIPTDRKKQIDEPPTKQSVGLPEDKFIFATFNNSYKLNENMFACWMRILQKLPDSVLWIVDDNEWATRNLKNYAAAYGVTHERLIFTSRVQPSAYLARMPLADVFLDNYPYNAGSTASDILWMGTPMVTLSGKTFVSRMAGSMLHHCGLNELFAKNYAEYESIAIRLHNDRDECERIRKQMLKQREPGQAFDMGLFVQDLEANYLTIIDGQQKSAHAATSSPLAIQSGLA